jgi:FxsC-like protein
VAGFDLRLSAHAATAGARTHSVLPVWWLPAVRELPSVARTVQNTKDQFDDAYAKYGLRYLLQRKATYDRYQDFLVRFTEQILRAADNPPDEFWVDDLTALPNAFDAALGQSLRPVGLSGEPAAGPRHVTFLMATRPSDVMRSVRNDLDTYGDTWADWRPYAPDCDDRVVVRAQQVASTRDLTSAPVVMDDSLAALVKQAQERNELLVLMVDPWVLQVPDCAALLATFDEVRSAHVAVVVPWEGAKSDVEDALEVVLLSTLGNWSEAGKEVFRSRVDTIDLFVDTLAEVLTAGQARVINHAEVARRAAEAGPRLRPDLGGDPV